MTTTPSLAQNDGRFVYASEAKKSNFLVHLDHFPKFLKHFKFPEFSSQRITTTCKKWLVWLLMFTYLVKKSTQFAFFWNFSTNTGGRGGIHWEWLRWVYCSVAQWTVWGSERSFRIFWEFKAQCASLNLARIFLWTRSLQAAFSVMDRKIESTNPCRDKLFCHFFFSTTMQW